MREDGLEAIDLAAKGRPGKVSESLATYLRANFRGGLSHHLARATRPCHADDPAQTILMCGYPTQGAMDIVSRLLANANRLGFAGQAAHPSDAGAEK